MDADNYNRGQLGGRFKIAHVTELVRRFQVENGLAADGKAGPSTLAVLDLMTGRTSGPIATSAELGDLSDLIIDTATGWLRPSADVEILPIDPSWYYARLASHDGKPKAIVAHYSATEHGTARAMAHNRARKIKPTDRSASWHVSVEGDGTIVQMAPFTVGCWHAGGPTAKPVPGVGAANRFAVGVELIGFGTDFPPAQVAAAARLWRALVRSYGIPRELAMIAHSQLDPTRKRDPGPVWTAEHAADVLDHAFA